MINSNYFGGLELTDSVELTTAAVTDVYEATSNSEICAGFTILNTHSSALEVSIYRYDTLSGTDVRYWKKSVPANDTLTETEVPRWLRKGWKIKAQVSEANVITITPTILKVSTNEAYNR